MPKPKNATSYKLSDEAHAYLAELAQHLGLNKTAVIEVAVRKLARAELPSRGRIDARPPAPRRGRPAKS